MRFRNRHSAHRRWVLWPILLSFSVACTARDGMEGAATVQPSSPPPAREPSSSIQADIYVMNVDGTGLERLTSHPLDDGTPIVWSPKGNRIMFSRGVPGNFGIYVMDPDGGKRVRLVPPEGKNAAGSWMPDGTIVLSSNRSGADRLYTMAVDGTNLRALPNTRDGDYFPVASPDGMSVAFMDSDGPESDIWIMGLDGSRRVPLAVAPLAQKWTSWSPDGKRLAYHDLPSETIRVADVAGGESRKLELGRPALMPAWSPNGRKMAFISDGEVCVTTIATRDVVCFERPGEEFGPAWSPDGDRIAFAHVKGRGAP